MRSRHRTQWAAQFAVASELCKRNYEVALTLGNHPAVDLMVISPRKKSFQIEVKGLYAKNYWQLRKQEPRSGLFYVFAYVPDDEPNQFFVMTQQTVNCLLDEHRAEYPDAHPTFRWGIKWEVANQHKDRWKILPDFGVQPDEV
jgi:hypothetical protein